MKRKKLRKIIEEKYGLTLKKGEGTHHIDMDVSNNNPDNMWAFTSNSEHMKAHMSLFKLVPKLMGRGIIGFDEWEGKYKLPKEIDYSNLVFKVGDHIIEEKDFEKLSKREKRLWYDIKKIYEKKYFKASTPTLRGVELI